MKFRRVTKPTARKLYDRGCKILLLPCNVSESALDGSNMWIKPVTISQDTCAEQFNKFDRTVRSFQYYNCNSELGYYPHYYVSEEDILNTQSENIVPLRGED